MSNAKPKILLVEDEVDLVELLQTRLGNNGYDVDAAYDGKQAVEKVRRNRPDIIILDIMLPKMNGYEVCDIIKKDANLKNIPIVVLSARVQDADKKKAFEAGADAYITKPFDSADLMKAVENYLKKSQK